MGKKTVFTFLLLMLLSLSLALGIFYTFTTAPSGPSAAGGVLVLPDQPSLVPLDGEWQFYWGRLFTPADLPLPNPVNQTAPLPQVWNKNAQINLPADGFATYRLIVMTEGPPQQMALLLPHISTSYHLWVNGKLLTSVGQVGPTANEAAPAYAIRQVQFESRSGANEILLQIANFSNLFGGVNSSIYLGTPEAIQQLDRQKTARDALLIGSLTIMAAYHFSLYLSRKKDRFTLQFGLLCLLVALRAAVTSQRYLLNLFPEMDWEWLTRLEYLTYYMAVPVFSQFIYSLYPTQAMKRYIRLLLPVCALFSLFMLFTPVKVYGILSLAYDVLTLAGCALVFYTLWQARKQYYFQALLFTWGFLVLFLAVLNDLLQYKNLVHTPLLLPFGLLVFMFCQAFILSLRFANAFHVIETMSEALKEKNTKLRTMYNELKKSNTLIAQWNQELEQMVQERTSELEAANNKLRYLSEMDGLTNIANRRHFDQVLQEEWQRSSLANQPLSVILLDVDYFKLYNDHYGHLAGDDCLKQLAQVIAGCACRRGDLAARFGGEEFIILLPNTSLLGALTIAEKIRSAAAQLDLPHAHSPWGKVTCSLGVATQIGQAETSPLSLLSLADKALYIAKAEGRNCVRPV